MDRFYWKFVISTQQFSAFSLNGILRGLLCQGAFNLGRKTWKKNPGWLYIWGLNISHSGIFEHDWSVHLCAACSMQQHEKAGIPCSSSSRFHHPPHPKPPSPRFYGSDMDPRASDDSIESLSVTGVGYSPVFLMPHLVGSHVNTNPCHAIRSTGENVWNQLATLSATNLKNNNPMKEGFCPGWA